MKKSILALLSLFVLSCASHDKHNKRYHTKIDAKKLKKDVSYVQKRITNMHPDLYWYISKEDLNKKFDSLSNTLNEPLTPNEFFMKISPVVASVHQGHMSMGMLRLTSADSLKKKYKGSVDPLSNFEYEYLNDRLFIKRNNSKTDTILQTGTEIIDINGVKPADLFTKYRKTFTSDGYNQTAIPKFFARRVNSFYINELGFVDSIKMNVVCADTAFYYTAKRTFEKSKKERKALAKKALADKKNDTLKDTKIVQTDTLPKLSKEEQKIKKKALKKLAGQKYYKNEWFGYDSKTKTFSKQITYPVAQDSTVAVLKIRDFSKGRIKVYDTIFAELNKHNVQNLIIDLRGNPGGRLNEIHKLAQYLNDTTFVFIKPATITNRATFLNLYRGKSVASKILGTPFISIFSTIRGLRASRNEAGELQVPIKSSKIAEPKPLNYKNNIYVITDGMTFSAAAIISSHLKGRNRAIFVGDETGGTFNGTVAGIMPNVKLPNSKLVVRVGLMTIKPHEQTEKEGYGVMPDTYIKPTIDDFLNDKDPELDWILNQINPNRNALN
ncbi:Peptidase family S41 [Paenimyroides ummariense]|uniref:Peptidase family S41 n=1 Tax=Paenimyroides ummariense TaxID=913024 RepID=A0A1I4YDR1_9FLAO|nr:S41 family peptidase [Paenimyroides ummariense]SFN36164.1 Peptidase family S41 [Paenimyroides ummariense]